MTMIIGIDPGLRKTGWGVIRSEGNKLTYVDCGTIYSSPKRPMAERLGELHFGLTEILQRYEPRYGAIEQTFVNSNAASSLKLGHARGTLMLTAQLAGVTLGEYAPNLVKKSVVGSGHADKHQMMVMIRHILPKANVTSEDAADALAVAICHSQMVHSMLHLAIKASH